MFSLPRVSTPPVGQFRETVCVLVSNIDDGESLLDLTNAGVKYGVDY